ncbi:MAG: RHS repeat-associated core domain-containing protein [Bacteroidetes bacterium]|nr:RHS repeat-associated core domain-containing protein [Bacteroidota bacterium]
MKRLYHQGVINTEKQYRGNFEFENSNLTAYNHDEGRLTPKTGGGYNLEYYLKDHLFSNRIIFADMNVNGSINAATEILEENTYYPYGLEQSGLMNAISSNTSPYQYSGKEMLAFNGYNMNDYGARYYDAALGRWNVMDELSEKYHSFSCYNFVVNNPMKYIDPDGREIVVAQEHQEQFKSALQSVFGNNGNAFSFENNVLKYDGSLTKLSKSENKILDGLTILIGQETKTNIIYESSFHLQTLDGGDPVTLVPNQSGGEVTTTVIESGNDILDQNYVVIDPVGLGEFKIFETNDNSPGSFKEKVVETNPNKSTFHGLGHVLYAGQPQDKVIDYDNASRSANKEKQTDGTYKSSPIKNRKPDETHNPTIIPEKKGTTR